MFYKAIIKDQKKLELKPGNLYQAALYALNACVRLRKRALGQSGALFLFGRAAVVREDHYPARPDLGRVLNKPTAKC